MTVEKAKELTKESYCSGGGINFYGLEEVVYTFNKNGRTLFSSVSKTIDDKGRYRNIVKFDKDETEYLVHSHPFRFIDNKLLGRYVLTPSYIDMKTLLAIAKKDLKYGIVLPGKENVNNSIDLDLWTVVTPPSKEYVEYMSGLLDKDDNDPMSVDKKKIRDRVDLANANYVGEITYNLNPYNISCK